MSRTDKDRREASERAALEAEAELARVKDRWPDIHDAATPIKDRGRVNHFTEAIEAAMKFRRKE